MLRYSIGHRPQLTFTADFHELVEGDLIPGPCVLRYDPLRLIQNRPEGASYEIQAYLRFHPEGGAWEGRSLVPAAAPLEDMADPSGQGYMLESSFPLSTGCEEIEAWFSCTYPDGSTHWDSAHGNNYHLRFPLHDLHIEEARVLPRAQDSSHDAFNLKVTGVAAVESMRVRWRIPKVSRDLRQETPLVATASTAAGRLWKLSTEILVPHGAAVVFDLVYGVRQREYTDDNQGRWYVAD